jgi:hypothetical protein
MQTQPCMCGNGTPIAVTDSGEPETLSPLESPGCVPHAASLCPQGGPVRTGAAHQILCAHHPHTMDPCAHRG